MADDLMLEFIAESRDHLATIEADLLAIEEAAGSPDAELINKVFRAAHSIKGGSGFFGLTKIKELSHKAETVLDMIRGQKISVNPEVINILLQAFDLLREMINHVDDSEDVDIGQQVMALQGLTSSFLPVQEKKTLRQDVEFSVPGAPRIFRIPQIDVEQARKKHQYIYLACFDLIHDIEARGKTPWGEVKKLNASGNIMDAEVDFAAVGTLEGETSNTIPFYVVHASVAEPDMAEQLYGIPAGSIKLLMDPHKPLDGKIVPIADEGDAPRESTPPSTAVPVTPAEPAVEAAPRPEPPAPAVAPEILPPAQAVEPPPVDEDMGPSSPRKKTETRQKGTAPMDSSLRVNVGLLEMLMNLAGELVLSRNQLREAVSGHDERAISISSQRISLVTSELQEAIMQTRLQPIGNIFAKFPRVVRDMAQTLEKDIQLDIEGKEVELDKTLIEGLSDPLTHMVRNAADHGIESPSDRQRAGKKPTGTVCLRAYHEAGLVIIELADDGKGIDPAKVAATAVRKGLLTQDQVREMSDKEKVNLIFLPGLSTAEKVTDVSGRGVGMDVVISNIERLGGKVEVDSVPGRGSMFRIKMPLTLAIIPCLIVTVASQRFAIPQVNVSELLHIRAEDVKKRVDVVGDAEVLLLRNELVPIIRFADLLGILPTYVDPASGERQVDRRTRIADRRSESLPQNKERRRRDGRRRSSDSDIDLVVVSTGTMQYAIIVDAFQNTEEIVVKPLGQHLKHLQEYAGATIMGDGRVALILDVGGVAAKAQLASLAVGKKKADSAEGDKRQDIHSLLLFFNGPKEPCSIPLESVLRIERIQARQIEKVGGSRTMQCRGESLPLLALSDAARVEDVDVSRDLVVVVTNVYGREVGLLGTMPVDVVETDIHIDQETLRQKGVAGSCIIRDQTVLMVDIFELVEAVHPEWVREKKREQPGKDGASSAILLAEDSDFFRAQETKIIESAGYRVIAAPDGEAAWQALQKNAGKISVVVTDIEMPRLNGLGLAQRIRADKRFAHLPIIGVTSLAGEDDVAKGKAAGIDDYQVKLDQDRLLAKLAELMPPPLDEALSA